MMADRPRVTGAHKSRLVADTTLAFTLMLRSPRAKIACVRRPRSYTPQVVLYSTSPWRLLSEAPTRS